MIAADRRGETLASEAAPRWPLIATALLLAALGLVPTALLLSNGTAEPHWARNVRQWMVWGIISAVTAPALARLGGAPLRELLARATRALLAIPRPVLALGVALLAALLALMMGWLAFDLRPVSGDELSQLWQARLLASGHLAARAPAYPEFFSTTMTAMADGRWFSQFPIGGPAFIAAGLTLGAPWIVNPLLTGWAAAAFYVFVSAIDDETTARRAALLFVLSPFVLVMGGSEMNHVPVLAAVATALAALPHWSRSRDAGAARRPALVIGVALGVAATCRPYDAVLVALALGIFQLVALRRRPELWPSIAWQCVAALVPVLLLMSANAATTGAPLLFGYDLLNGAAHRPGFHITPGLEDHTPARGLRLASSYLMTLDSGLFAWPVPAILLLVLALLLQRRASRWDVLLAGIFVLLLLGYGAYWAESYFAGPRFLFAAVPFFVLFAARLPRLAGERLRNPTARTAIALLFPLWILLAWLLPANRAHAYGVRTVILLNAAKRSSGDEVARQAELQGLTNALVFVPDGWHKRLAARLRAAGVPPLEAEQVVIHADACRIQLALDALATHALPAGEPTRRAFVGMVLDTSAAPLPNMRPGDQLSLTPGRPLPPTCAAELQRSDSYGVGLPELLPAMAVDGAGRLAGNVIFARDFGLADERLRAELGGRRWYVADITPTRDGISVRFDPYQRPADTTTARRR